MILIKLFDPGFYNLNKESEDKFEEFMLSKKSHIGIFKKRKQGEEDFLTEDADTKLPDIEDDLKIYESDDNEESEYDELAYKVYLEDMLRDLTYLVTIVDLQNVMLGIQNRKDGKDQKLFEDYCDSTKEMTVKIKEKWEAFTDLMV